jgi:hypothetical protein
MNSVAFATSKLSAPSKSNNLAKHFHRKRENCKPYVATAFHLPNM